MTQGEAPFLVLVIVGSVGAMKASGRPSYAACLWLLFNGVVGGSRGWRGARDRVVQLFAKRGRASRARARVSFYPSTLPSLPLLLT